MGERESSCTVIININNLFSRFLGWWERETLGKLMAGGRAPEVWEAWKRNFI